MTAPPLPTVELINTGTELLLGNTPNSHLAYIGRQLFRLGIRIHRQVCVGDGPEIGSALAEALPRSWAIITTGGLGPTTDDLTRETAAALLGLDLVEDNSVLRAIEERFARRQLRMAERNKRQALVPRGARVLENPHGTAPGLYLAPRTLEGGPSTPHIFLLPGPPRELCPMFENFVKPILCDALPTTFAPPAYAEFKVIGLGESDVESRVGAAIESVGGVELGYCARVGEVDIRLIGADAAVEKASAIIRETLQTHIVSEDGSDLAEVVVRSLTAMGRRLAVAESCTGGFLAHRITNVPGASAVFVEDFIAYANRAKELTLGIDAGLIETHGSVSAEVAVAMAEGARRLSGADYALATTGIAGPSGGTLEKPTGTVFIALARNNGAPLVERRYYPTQREIFKIHVSQAALDLLRRNFEP